jgi:hypothetical protein
MSGGYFKYEQFKLQQIADDIEQLIVENDETEWDYKFKPETLYELETAVNLLRRAYIYVQRIDYLVSSDDSEATFLRRLNEQLKDQDV